MECKLEVECCYFIAEMLVEPGVADQQSSDWRPAASPRLVASRPPSGLCAFSNVWDPVGLSLALYGTCWSSSPPT